MKIKSNKMGFSRLTFWQLNYILIIQQRVRNIEKVNICLAAKYGSIFRDLAAKSHDCIQMLIGNPVKHLRCFGLLNNGKKQLTFFVKRPISNV